MKGSNAAHSQLVDDSLLAIGALPYVRCWKRIVGLFHRLRFDDRGKVCGAIPVKVGIPGESDIDGILKNWADVGIRFHFECKTGNATQEPDQKNFEAMIKSMGGVYAVVRAPSEALEIVRRERLRGAPEGWRDPLVG